MSFLNCILCSAQGSCVLEYRGEDGLNLNLVGWRGTCSLKAYVSIPDCVHYIRLLGGDASIFGTVVFCIHCIQQDIFCTVVLFNCIFYFFLNSKLTLFQYALGFVGILLLKDIYIVSCRNQLSIFHVHRAIKQLCKQ